MPRQIFSKPKTKRLSLAQQVIAMRHYFPQFVFRRDGVGKGSWIGTVKPTPKSPEYRVRIEYDWYSPRVFVESPNLLKSCPHRYSDGSLCLYYPPDRSYSSNSFIANTIVPWVCEWLYFYEIWLETGIWWGDEAPHTSPKDSEKGKE